MARVRADCPPPPPRLRTSSLRTASIASFAAPSAVLTDSTVSATLRASLRTSSTIFCSYSSPPAADSASESFESRSVAVVSIAVASFFDISATFVHGWEEGREGKMRRESENARREREKEREGERNELSPVGRNEELLAFHSREHVPSFPFPHLNASSPSPSSFHRQSPCPHRLSSPHLPQLLSHPS